MPSPLERKIRKQIAAGFKGKLLSGTIRRYVPGSGVDEMGDPLPGTYSTFAFEGIRESFDAAYRDRAGIPETDVSVLVLLGSVKPSTEPVQDDQIKIEGRWHQCRRVMEIDPAGASAKLQAYEIADPTT